MKLIELLKELPTYTLNGDKEIEIRGLAYDSRQVQPGFLFVAMKGYSQNGHDFLHDAIRNGASLLVAEEFEGDYQGIGTLKVPDSRKALSES